MDTSATKEGKPEQSLQEWRDLYARDSQHPVLAALAVRSAALVARLAVWGQCSPGSPEWWTEFSQMPRLLSELGEIAPWMPLLPGVPESRREQKKLLECQLRDSDISYDNGREIMEIFSRSGAPVTARVRAVNALEMLLAGSAWETIIQTLCPYSHEHSENCRHAIRRGVLRLKKILSKYNIMPIDELLHAKRRTR